MNKMRSSLPGILPTLGLMKYQGVNLHNQEKNPFSVHDRTEKMLVLREREREFNDYNIVEKEGMRVWEKENKTRPNR